MLSDSETSQCRYNLRGSFGLRPQDDQNQQYAVMLSDSETSQCRYNLRGSFGLRPQDDRNLQDDRLGERTLNDFLHKRTCRNPHFVNIY
jgi:hypothetical protein